MKRIKTLTCAAALTLFVAAVALTPAAFAADPYPAKPIRMVIGFPAGGPTDVNARLFAQAMSEQLGQPIIVDNKAGAGSNVASMAVLAAPTDGYTILYNTSSLVLGAMLYKSAKFDPLKDFIPVVRTAGVPLVVAASATVPAKNFADFMELVKASPGKLNYASSGAGTIDHLAAALLATQLDLKLEHVPYKGTAPALVDLVAGNTQMFVTTLNTLMPFIREKRLIPLAIASVNRSPLLPDVPTVSEVAGLPGFEITAWNGIVVAAGTSPVIVERLNAAVNAVLQQKEFVAKLRAAGTETYGGTSEAYGAYLKSETARWRTVIQKAGVTPQ
jgi:tripartite-type tricarboxylate transporter receptor subunit TctC